MSQGQHSGSERRRCAQCGAELLADRSPELCPKCLLKQALATEPEPAGTVVVPNGGVVAGGLPAAGQQFGHYRIVRPLGGGGMGAVFEAEDLENGRRVALKVLRQALDSPEARERFFREGRLAASINHPNSVYVFGTEEVVGTPVIAMELVPGGTLEERVRSHGPMPPGEAVDAILQIIAGLEAAQRIGILHRDIKPSNCFVDTDGTVKVGDFGLSISTALRTEPTLTATGAFLGTPAFCSPEQLRGEELNARADMYSIGATLFYLLTGQTPFSAKNVVALIATVFEQPAPSPRQIKRQIPAGLDKVVRRCLEKQPGERFKTYGELAAALAPYSSSAPVPAMLAIRFVAGLIDVVVLGLLSLIVVAATSTDPLELLNHAWGWQWLIPVALGCGASVVYYTVLEGVFGATLGKALCGLRVSGPERQPPGFGRAFIRALIYVFVPLVPLWSMVGVYPKTYIAMSSPYQFLGNVLFYATLALLFSTTRKRNGYAAAQDLASGTRVIGRVAFQVRPVLSSAAATPAGVENLPQVGPYRVLETLQAVSGGAWLLGYDLRLLRKVWIRTVPPGRPPVEPALRSLNRVGRLRWLTGRRSSEENWDAFEAVAGKPLLSLRGEPQPWEQVRFWLYDLAVELNAAGKDGTLPQVLTPDRVWITGDGRAKLLDFPAPGLPEATVQEAPELEAAPGRTASQHLLVEVARSALTGERNADSVAELPLRLPLHAREFLAKISTDIAPDAFGPALRPLLQKPATVTRLRRGVVIAACMLLPLLGMFGAVFGLSLLHRWQQRYPGLFELTSLLQDRWGSRVFHQKQGTPPDRDYAIYIATHYRSLITNREAWSSGLAHALIKGEGRQFAEQSLTNASASQPDEIAQAEKLIKPRLSKPGLPDIGKHPMFLLALFEGVLAVYIGLASVLAALLFRGGLVLLATGVVFVRRDGQRASRLRMFWRSLVAWVPVWLAFIPTLEVAEKTHILRGLVATAGLLVLTVCSILLPQRGLPDRLAGTWPVPR